MVDGLLDDARRTRPHNPPPKALVSPHAGYVYSGATAALGYATVDPDARPVSRVVLAGPTHRVAVQGVAVPSVQAFSTPLGDVPVDQAALGSLAGLPQVVVRDDVHADEHALEVQLPFLQRILTGFTVVPLAVGDLPPTEVAEVLDALWGGPETLVIISTDLSHYQAYDRARELDAETVERIMRVEASVGEHRACGVRPLNGFLVSAAGQGLQPTLLDLRNSGDTAGELDRVVGYTCIAWHEERP
jgi:AmmeMemoRadiSam system protein B